MTNQLFVLLDATMVPATSSIALMMLRFMILACTVCSLTGNDHNTQAIRTLQYIVSTYSKMLTKTLVATAPILQFQQQTCSWEIENFKICFFSLQLYFQLCTSFHYPAYPCSCRDFFTLTSIKFSLLGMRSLYFFTTNHQEIEN